MFQRRFGLKSASSLAWIVPAVVLLALLLILVFGNGDGPLAPDIETVERSPEHEIIRIGSTEGYADLQPSATLSEERRQAVLQNLSELRAEYKLVGPGVITTADKGNEAGRQLARTVGTLLANYNLGQFRAGVQPPLAAPGATGVIVYARPKDAVIARAVVRSISPLLIGNVTLVFADDLKTGDLLLVVAGIPGFTTEGVAVFR